MLGVWLGARVGLGKTTVGEVVGVEVDGAMELHAASKIAAIGRIRRDSNI
jgi:hypothetical protein